MSHTNGKPYRWSRALLVAVGLTTGAGAAACQDGAVGTPTSLPVDVAPGVSRELADHRAATISDLRYRLAFRIPVARSEPIRGHLIASFTVAQPGAVVLDFAQPAEAVGGVQVGGESARFEVVDEHIVLTDGVPAGPVTVEVEFTAGDGSLNRQDVFLYTLFVPDRARVAFPVFDQPNLKARFQLTLEIPAEWTAVSNASLLDHAVSDQQATFRFVETDPISTYLFAFAAGRFQTEEAERAGRRMVMYHRETDADRLARNRDEIFDLHAAALDWLEDYTGIPYPFEKFDFVLVPSFQYGGMEHPGSIFYLASALLLDESATQNQLLGRASLIAHETAHMWFGDLVTMEWFNDVWMKEVFANVMAAKMVNPTFPDVDHDLRFLLAHYPGAYGVDRTPGANPIRQVLENLNEAGTLYGPIIYQKAPIVMKHLERVVGEETFRDGLREYLDTNRYGNASWADLIAVLDRRSDEDLETWSQVWVSESGRPTVEVMLEADGVVINSLTLRQSDPTDAGRLWNQRLDVVLGYADGSLEQIEAQLDDAMVDVEGAVGLTQPDFVLANGDGVGYGLMALEPRTCEYLLRELPEILHGAGGTSAITGAAGQVGAAVLRAVAWLSLSDGVLEGEVDPAAFIDLAMRALPAESDEQNVQLVLRYVASSYWRHLTPAARIEVAEELETLLWEGVTTAGRPSLAAAYFGAFRNIAVTEAALGRLESVWRGDQEIPGLPLAEPDFTAIAQTLALREVPGAPDILATQRDRIDNPDRRQAFEFVMPALSGDEGTRDGFFASLADPANRARERWVLTGLGFLLHPLRARASERYIRPSLDLLEEVQRTGDIFFPAGWVQATLGGHQTASAADVVQRFLDERTDLPARLRAKLLQSADGLFRAARIVEGRP